MLSGGATLSDRKALCVSICLSVQQPQALLLAMKLPSRISTNCETESSWDQLRTFPQAPAQSRQDGIQE